MKEYTPGIIGLATVIPSGQLMPLASLSVAMAVRYGLEAEGTAIGALRRAASKLEARAQL